MHLTPTLLSAISLCSSVFTTVSASTSQHSSADIFYWPVASSQPAPLARISYEPTSLTSDVISYSPPNAPTNHDRRGENGENTEDLVRVGLYTSTPTHSKQWVGTLTTWSSLVGSEGHRPTLRLHLDSATSQVYQVSLSPFSSSNASTSANPSIELVRNEAGPSPHLNRPIVVGPDGKTPEEAVEKTLFQRYWWVFLAVAFLAMSGGGGGEGQ